MELGGGFNHLISPNQDDLSKNTAEFISWWSPGQYLVPYFFKLIFSTNTGQASALTITLCQLLGLAGFYTCFKKLGFSSFVSALSILFIACQQFFVVPYVFYNGGEVLLFAFLGWFLYGCIVIEKPGLKLFIFVLLAGWLGFFCKSSIMWVYGAGLLFLWIRLSSRQNALRQWMKNGVWVAIPAVLSFIAIWAFYLSKGESPASYSFGSKLTLTAFGFPLASPLLAGFSVDDLLHGLIYHTDTPLLTDVQSVIVLLILALLSLWLIIALLRKIPGQNYKLLIKIFYIVSVLFFSYVYFRRMPISYEARHFRIIELIIVPGIIYLVTKLKPAYRYAFGLIWVAIGITSIYYVAKGYSYNKNKSAHGISGFAQQEIDQKALNQVMALDRQNTNATFVFIGSLPGLEIQHNRIITLQPIDNDLQIDFDDYEQLGYGGQLYIILPESYNGPKEKMILKSFPGYKGWYASMLSDGFVMYQANQKR